MSGYWPKGLEKGAKQRGKKKRALEREQRAVETALDKLGKSVRKKKR